MPTFADAGHVVYCMILDSMKMYSAAYGCEAEQLSVTPAMEAALKAYYEKEFNKPFSRDAMTLGMHVKWGASDFSLDNCGLQEKPWVGCSTPVEVRDASR